jgi:hypothetical protein
MKPGESNPVHLVHPVEKAQRRSAAHTPIPWEFIAFLMSSGAYGMAVSNEQCAMSNKAIAHCALLIAHCSLPISGCCVERARTIFLP